MHPDLDEKPYVEYIAGRPVRKVSPKRRHALLQLAMGRWLQDCAAGRGPVGTEWRFHLDSSLEGRTTFVPDVAFVSQSRMMALSASDREEPPFAPDIAIEVRSPSDRIPEIEAKIALYLQYGSVLVLDVIPDQLAIRAISKDGETVYRDGDTLVSSAFPWLRLDIADIFAKVQ